MGAELSAAGEVRGALALVVAVPASWLDSCGCTRALAGAGAVGAERLKWIARAMIAIPAATIATTFLMKTFYSDGVGQASA